MWFLAKPTLDPEHYPDEWEHYFHDGDDDWVGQERQAELDADEEFPRDAD